MATHQWCVSTTPTQVKLGNPFSQSRPSEMATKFLTSNISASMQALHRVVSPLNTQQKGMELALWAPSARS